MNLSLPKRGWQELKLSSGLANTHEDISANVESAIARDLPSLQDVMETEQGAVAIVGSGPSLKRNWEELKNFDGKIIACNAAFQFLLEKGVIAHYCYNFDADPLMLEFITPRDDVTYLIGSRCPPKAFDMLQGCKIICWHAAGDRDTEEILQKHGKFSEPMVNGGSAAVTRCMYVAAFLGFKELHLYGADSSFDGEDTHIRKSTTQERWLAVKSAGRAFWTAPWMAVQANDYRVLFPILRAYGIKVVPHGDGLIPHIARVMNKEEQERGTFIGELKQFVRKSKIIWRYV